MRWLFTALLAQFLIGCASEQPGRRAGVLTIAVSGDIVLIGRGRTFGSEGTFKLMSLEENPIECSGRFRYDFPPRGRARFSCSDGESGSIRINADGNLTGWGTGQSSRGRIQLVYGYSLREANRRLELPPGKVLVHHESGIALVDKEALEDQ